MNDLFARPIVLAEVDSTNRYLVDAARDGAPEGTVVIADMQSSGRGRLDRSWIARPGSSLLCSMLFRPRLDLEDAHVVATIVALGASNAIATLTGERPALKWPNDLLFGSRKVAGLLGEVVHHDGTYALVIGIGINLRWSSEHLLGIDREDATMLADRATSLFEVSGAIVDRDELAEQMLDDIAADYAQMTSATFRRSVMDRYRNACCTIGSRVRVELRNGSYDAEAIDVSDQGLLMVREQGQIRELAAGDVVHLRTRST